MALILTVLAVAAIAVGGWIFLSLPQFGRLPSGARLERVRRSPNYRNGEFKNLYPTRMMTSDKSMLRTMWEFLFGDKDGVEPDAPIRAVKTNLRRIPAEADRFVWFGHSSYLLQLDGKRALVDPVLCAASPVPFVNKPFAGTDIYKPDDIPAVDYLIITHDHWDHLDYRTVTALKDRVGAVVCPLGVGEHFERWGFSADKLVELDWFETAELEGGVAVECLPTRHFSGRGLARNQSLWGAFLLDFPSARVLVGGDGGYGKHLKEIGDSHGEIDLAILENGQYNDDWRDIHTMPEHLGQAAADLRARHLLTVHHSKYALAHHRWDEPLANERKAAEEQGIDLIVATIGEPVDLARIKRNNNQTSNR